MRLAKSYEGATIIRTFSKDGKPYATIRDKCSRCDGSGVLYGGSGVPYCYRCSGVGFEQQDVRMYTDKEFERMERAAEKRRVAQEKRDKAYIAKQNLRTLHQHGFEDVKAYAVLGNTFKIIDELKDAGAKYSPTLHWVCPTEPTWLTDNSYATVIVTDVFTIADNGLFVLRDDAEDFIESLEPIQGAFLGNLGQRLTVEATLKRRIQYPTYYGMSNIYIFKTACGNTVVWKTTVAELDEDTTYEITGTVKEHNIYRRVRQTVLTRCKIKGE